MQLRRPLLASVGTLALIAAAITACAPAAELPTASSSAAPSSATCTPETLPTVTAGTLTFGTDQPVYEPWFVDNKPENGQGFEGAIAAELATTLGYDAAKITWVRVGFNEAIAPGVKKFDIDINEFSITEERRKAVDFSTPYYDVQQAIVGLKGTAAANAKDLAALKTLKVGAQVGTSSLTAAKAVNSNVQVFNTNDDAKLALQNGQIDALVVDVPTAYFITSAELDNGVIIGQIPSGTDQAGEQFGLVLDKGSRLTPCVSWAVDTLRSAGKLSALEKQWLQGAAVPILK